MSKRIPVRFSLSVLVLAGVTQASAFDAPGPQAEPYVWRNVKIVAGGFITGIVTHPGQKGLMYARTDIGGAYRWSAERGHWVPLTDWLGPDDWNLMGVESIAIDADHPRRVYVAAGAYTQSWAGNGAIFRSTDSGRHFKRFDLPFKLGANEDGRCTGERLAVNPLAPEVLYLGSRHDGLWKSTDYGETWAQVASFPVIDTGNAAGIAFVLIAPSVDAAGKQAIYVGASMVGGLYRSLDDGATWEAVPGQPTTLPNNGWSPSTPLPSHAALSTTGVLYVTYSNAPGPNGVGNGAVWKLTTADGGWTNITPIGPWWATTLWYGFSGVTVDAANPATVMVSTIDRWWPGDTVYRSLDAGASWIGLRDEGDSAPWGHQPDNYSVRDSSLSPYLNFGGSSAEFGHWIADVEIDPFDSNHVLYVTGATIWASNDVTNVDTRTMTHWFVGADGIEETSVGHVLSPPSGAPLLSAVGDVGGFRHDDLNVSPAGGMYTNPITTSTTGLDFAELNPNVVVRVGWGTPHGASSLDGGTTWAPFASEAAGGSSNPGQIAVSADGTTIIWSPGSGTPSFSRDNGATWTPCLGAPSGRTVVADRVNPAKFYVFDPGTGSVSVSLDGGETFAVKAAGLPGDNARLRAVPGFEGHVWLPLWSGLYVSKDSGATFVQVTNVAHAEAIGFGQAAHRQRYPALYLSGQIGTLRAIYRSIDGGRHWVRINDHRHQYGWIGVIGGDPRVFGRVYLGTNGRGIVCGDAFCPFHHRIHCDHGGK
jgi:hypothetical protein